MKTFVKIFLLLVLLMVVAAAVFAAPARTAKKDSDTTLVRVTPTHYKDLLVLKADKDFIGAVVEVHDATGALLISGSLQKRKMILDFYDTPSGTYTILVIRKGKTLSFNHTKTSDSVILN